MNHPIWNWFGVRFSTTMLLVLFHSNLSSQNVSIENQSYFCQGDGLLSEAYVESINNLNNPCIDYNTELPFDLVYEDNFDGTQLNTLNWKGLFDSHSSMFNVDEFGDAAGTIDYAWSYFDDLANSDKHYDINGGTIKLITREHQNSFQARVLDHNSCDDFNSPYYNQGYDINSCPLKEDGFANLRSFNYSNGVLQSRRKFKHGYFEARIKLPDVNGVWPAFWLAPGKGSNTEIDIFEFAQENYGEQEINLNPLLFGLPKQTIEEASKKMIMTYHLWNNDEDKCLSANATALDFNFSNEWHTYGLYWDEYQMHWTLDNIVIYSVYHYYYNLPNGAIVNISSCNEVEQLIEDGFEIWERDGYPSEYTYIIIAQGVKNFGSFYNPDPNLNKTSASVDAIFPSIIEVDWVRVWAIRNCETDFYACNSDNLPGNISAKSIAMGSFYNPFDSQYNDCNVIIQNRDHNDAYAYWAQIYHDGQTVDAVATENIKLLPGFHVQKGAEFRARVEPCYGADLRSSSGPSNEHIYALLDEVEKKRIKKPVQDSLNTENEISVYPNPNSEGILNFQSKYEFKEIIIFDLQGKQIQGFDVSKSNSISILDLPKGIYLLQFISNDEQRLFKKIMRL